MSASASRLAVAAGGAAVALFATAPAAGQVPDPLTVHVSVPLTGSLRSFAEDVARGAELALEDAGGRAGGHAVRLAIHDSGDHDNPFWSPEATSANARRAASDPAAIAYLGEFSSSASSLSMPILNEAGILQVSPSNTHTGLTRPGWAACCGEPDRYFPTGRRHYARVAAADHLQAGALVDYLGRRRSRRVALVDDEESYGRGLMLRVQRRLSRGGAAAVVRARLLGVGHNAGAIARRVVRRRADALVFVGSTPEGARRLWRVLHRRAPRLELFATDAVAGAAFTRRIPAGAARRTRVTTMHLAPSAYPPPAAAVLSALRERHGRDVGPWSLYAYEAIRLILDAVAQAGSHADIADLRAAAIDQVFATRDRPSVIGRYSIDEFGDATHSRYGGWRIRRGRLSWDRVLRTR